MKCFDGAADLPQKMPNLQETRCDVPPSRVPFGEAAGALAVLSSPSADRIGREEGRTAQFGAAERAAAVLSEALVRADARAVEGVRAAEQHLQELAQLR